MKENLMSHDQPTQPADSANVNLLVVMPLPEVRHCEAFTTIDEARARFRLIRDRVTRSPGLEIAVQSALADHIPVCVVVAPTVPVGFLDGPGVGRVIEISEEVYQAIWLRHLRKNTAGLGTVTPAGDRFSSYERDPDRGVVLYNDGTIGPRTPRRA